MSYKNIYINLCYLIHPNGAVDYTFISAPNKFVGIPFNYSLFFFTDTSVVHRNLLTQLTQQQSKLFI